jgi:hypothetical protein
VPQRVIEKIRDAIRKGNYDMTMHAYEEMAEDNLTIIDVENAVLSGIVKEKQKEIPGVVNMSFMEAHLMNPLQWE